MAETVISLRVNGAEATLQKDSGRSLLQALRDELGLTGVKDGCTSGDCGACVVLLDGRPVNSCMVLAPQAEGADITTVEGLASEQGQHPLQLHFAREWAFQCGFCTPGMLMSCLALLQQNPNPNREDILEAVSGNFCRCTGYQGVVRAVQKAAAELAQQGAARDE